MLEYFRPGDLKRILPAVGNRYYSYQESARVNDPCFELRDGELYVGGRDSNGGFRL